MFDNVCFAAERPKSILSSTALCPKDDADEDDDNDSEVGDKDHRAAKRK